MIIDIIGITALVLLIVAFAYYKQPAKFLWYNSLSTSLFIVYSVLQKDIIFVIAQITVLYFILKNLKEERL